MLASERHIGMADADVRLAFALIPSEPHFSSVISASQEVTVYHDNLNVIDADRFPPHVTLHICTVPSARLPSLFERLERTATQIRLLPDLEPAGLTTSGGYVTLDIARTPDLMAVHRWTIEAAAWARGFESAEGQAKDAERYGSEWVLDRFKPHYSIAKVARDEVDPAHALARKVLGDLPVGEAAWFEVCDIGMRSERWDSLLRLPRST